MSRRLRNSVKNVLKPDVRVDTKTRSRTRKKSERKCSSVVSNENEKTVKTEVKMRDDTAFTDSAGYFSKTPPKPTLLDLADAAASIQNESNFVLGSSDSTWTTDPVRTSDNNDTEVVKVDIDARGTEPQTCRSEVEEEMNAEEEKVDSCRIRVLPCSDGVKTLECDFVDMETRPEESVVSETAEQRMETDNDVSLIESVREITQGPGSVQVTALNSSPDVDQQNTTSCITETPDPNEVQVADIDSKNGLTPSCDSKIQMFDIMNGGDIVVEVNDTSSEIFQTENLNPDYYGIQTLPIVPINGDARFNDEKFVHLTTLDQLSMDQLLGGIGDHKQLPAPPTMSYGNFYVKPKAPSVKTKAAADRLRNLLQLPPEPRTTSRPRVPIKPSVSRSRSKLREPLKPPILNPALANRFPGVVPPPQPVQPRRGPLQCVTLTPVRVNLPTVPTRAEVQRHPHRDQARHEDPRDERRIKYDRAIADLKRPTPLDMAVNRAHAPAPQQQQGLKIPVKVLPMVAANDNQKPVPVPRSSSLRPETWMTKNGRVKRPMNAFMVWSRKARPEVASMMANPTNALVSVKLGDLWREMTEEEKKPYYEEAHKIRLRHNQLFPDWMYKPLEHKRCGEFKIKRPRQSSTYWRNFVKFGNVEGFSIRTLSLEEEPSMTMMGSDPETAAATSAIAKVLNDEPTSDMAPSSENGQAAEICETNHPMKNHDLPMNDTTASNNDVSDHSDIIRQAFLSSQQIVQTNAQEDSAQYYSKMAIGEGGVIEKQERLTPLQQVQMMSSDIDEKVPFTTSNLVLPMKLPSSPPPPDERMKNKLCYNELLRLRSEPFEIDPALVTNNSASITVQDNGSWSVTLNDVDMDYNGSITCSPYTRDTAQGGMIMPDYRTVAAPDGGSQYFSDIDPAQFSDVTSIGTSWHSVVSGPGSGGYDTGDLFPTDFYQSSMRTLHPDYPQDPCARENSEYDTYSTGAETESVPPLGPCSGTDYTQSTEQSATYSASVNYGQGDAERVLLSL